MHFGAGWVGFGTYQVVQHPHESLKLVLAQAALVQGPKGGAGTAHSPQAMRHALLRPLQHNQVLCAACTRQCRHLWGTGTTELGTPGTAPPPPSELALAHRGVMGLRPCTAQCMGMEMRG